MGRTLKILHMGDRVIFARGSLKEDSKDRVINFIVEKLNGILQ